MGVPHDYVDLVPVCIAKERHDGDKILHIIGRPRILTLTTALVVPPAKHIKSVPTTTDLPTHQKSNQKESNGKRRATRFWKR